jgi:hypothetical protein
MHEGRSTVTLSSVLKIGITQKILWWMWQKLRIGFSTPRQGRNSPKLNAKFRGWAILSLPDNSTGINSGVKAIWFEKFHGTHGSSLLPDIRSASRCEGTGNSSAKTFPEALWSHRVDLLRVGTKTLECCWTGERAGGGCYRVHDRHPTRNQCRFARIS